VKPVDKGFRQYPHPRTGLVIGARVFPGAGDANAVLWIDGVIRAIDQSQELARQAPQGCPVLEFPHATVTAGFIDSHTHFAQWALKGRQVDLVGAGTRGEAVRRVAAAEPVHGWVLGQGWDANGWTEPPTRDALDAVSTAPVFLDSLDVHAAWVNSAALARAGVTSASPDPPGGRIVRDPASEPTGVLLELAVDLVRRVVPAPTDDALHEALLTGQRRAHQLGVTGIHDVEEVAVLRAFERLEREDQLRMRVLFHPPVAELPRLVALGMRSGAGSPWLTSGGVKLFLDGSLGSRTAWMLQPYEGSRDDGMALTSGDSAERAVRLAAQHGIAATVHAIGDAAVRHALEILEPLPRVALPHRIEHFQCVHPDDLDRAARAGIVLSMQPAHLLVDIPLADRHWGRRGRLAYAFRTLAARGSRLAFGSDAPVAPLDPRPGVYAAMDRRALGGGRDAAWYGAERMSFENVVTAYTATPAFAAGWSARLGTLRPGAAADLVAWDVDPAVYAGDGEAFLDARVRLTVVDGEIMLQS
jgi:predicted amidohydrolase YtcJ